MENLILRWCRRSLEYTTTEVAERTGITEDAYLSMEAGFAVPSWKQAKQLGELFKVEGEFLFFAGQMLDNIRLLKDMAEDYASQNAKLLEEMRTDQLDKKANKASGATLRANVCSTKDNATEWVVITTILQKLPLTTMNDLLWQLFKQALLTKVDKDTRLSLTEFYEDCLKLFAAITRLAADQFLLEKSETNAL